MFSLLVTAFQVNSVSFLIKPGAKGAEILKFHGTKYVFLSWILHFMS